MGGEELRKEKRFSSKSMSREVVSTREIKTWKLQRIYSELCCCEAGSTPCMMNSGGGTKTIQEIRLRFPGAEN